MPRYGIECSRATRQARILPSQPREPKPAGNQYAVHGLQLALRLFQRHPLGVDPAHPDVAAVVDPCVLERLVHGEVGVVQLHVLADEADRHLDLAQSDPLGQFEPLAEVGVPLGQTELAADEVVEALLLERGGHEVHVRDVLVGDHVLRLDVGEERDLVAHIGRDHVARSADDDVGVDTDAPQLVHGVLGRLRLQLAGRVDVRDERDVDVEDVLCARLAPELADRLQERQRLDVADRPADLADHDVGVALLGRAADPVLDLVRDVRDHLDGLAEVVTLALAAEHAVPDATLGVVRAPGEVLVEEALVVADVEVGLGAVLGDEDLAVLERAHRAGVDVEIGIELLDVDLQAPRLEQPTKRRSGDALAQGRDDAAGDEDVPGLAHACRPAASRSRSTGVRSIALPTEVSLAEEVEGRERSDRQPLPSPREALHGTQA